MTLLEMMQPRQECVRLYDDIKVNSIFNQTIISLYKRRCCFDNFTLTTIKHSMRSQMNQ
jgi:hypothetical protein